MPTILKKLKRILPAYLIAAGCSGALMCMLGITQALPLALAVALVGAVLTELVDHVPKIGWLLPVVLLLLPVPYFLTAGKQLISEMLSAIILELRDGLPAAFLYANPFAVLIGWEFSVFWTYSSDDVEYSRVGLIGTIIITLGLVVSGHEEALPYLIPAIIAAFASSTVGSAETKRLWPAYAVVAALAGVLLIALPQEGVTIEPLREKTAEIRQQIHDLLFYTDSRDVFSLAGIGYYPNGRSQLGGKVELDDTPIMQVVTPKKVYLRGAVLNEYTGSTWLDTTGGRRYLWNDLRWRSDRAKIFDMYLPEGALGSAAVMTEQTVRIRMLTDSASTLFLPQRTRELTTGGSLMPYFKSGSEVFTTHNLEAGDTWSVTAAMCLATDAGMQVLIEACAEVPDTQYAEIVNTYTTLPTHLQQIVYDLAYEAAGSAVTPFERATNICNYLRRNYRYTLDVSQDDLNLDFVTNFLLNTREGYCTYFATAMTVLCRMVGLPARYVEGYVAVPDENGNAILTAKNGHAWTEVYFNGFGWLTFDATGFDQQSDASGQSSEDEPEDTPENDSDNDSEDDSDGDTENEPQPQENDSPDDSEDSDEPEDDPDSESPEEPEAPAVNLNSPWLWLLLVLMATAAGVYLRIRRTSPQYLARRADTSLAAFEIWLQAVFDILAVRRIDKHAEESPQGYLMRIGPTSLRELGAAVSRVYYGGCTPADEDVRLAANCAAQLTRALTKRQRAALLWRQGFVPHKKRDYHTKT